MAISGLCRQCSYGALNFPFASKRIILNASLDGIELGVKVERRVIILHSGIVSESFRIWFNRMTYPIREVLKVGRVCVPLEKQLNLINQL